MASDHSLAHLTVRLGAVAANYREVQRRAAPAAVAPVVKANAYGMGIAPVAHALSNAGADSFFVARLEEGIEARALLPHARIFVLDGIAPGTAPALVAHRLTPVLNSLEEIAEWSARARAERRELDAALQIDTGMNRSGLSHAELSQLASRIRESLVGINLVLILESSGLRRRAGARDELDSARALSRSPGRCCRRRPRALPRLPESSWGAIFISIWCGRALPSMAAIRF